MENEVLLYSLGSAIQSLRRHKEYARIKSIYEYLKSNGFDITKVGRSEAERYLKMWLTSFIAAQCNSKDEEIKNHANEVINEIRKRRNLTNTSSENLDEESQFEEGFF